MKQNPLHNMAIDPAKLAKDADIIKAAAEIFGVDTVKVCKWNGPWVPIKVDDLVSRMKNPKHPTMEK